MTVEVKTVKAGSDSQRQRFEERKNVSLKSLGREQVHFLLLGQRFERRQEGDRVVPFAD